nr:hypothetical protein [Crocosphaera sp.]
QVINNHSLNNSTEIINELEKLKIFEIPELTDWYFSAKFHYPKSKNYLETLDYLRLLILEHIRDFKLM